MEEKIFKSVLLRVLILVIVSIGTFGCATQGMKADNFASYAGAISNIGVATDKVLDATSQLERKAFTQEFCVRKDAKLEDLPLFVESSASIAGSCVEGVPLLYKLALSDSLAEDYSAFREARLVFQKMNGQFINYANLLAKLADKDLIKRETFDQAAQSLNQSSYRLYQILNPNTSITSDDTAVISGTIMRIFQAHLEKERREAIKESLESMQKTIKLYVCNQLSLIVAMEAAQQRAYTTLISPMNEGWNKNPPGDPKRVEMAAKALDLKETHVKNMRVLNELKAAYSALPAAHMELAASVDNPHLRTKALQDFLAITSHLGWMSENLMGK